MEGLVASSTPVALDGIATKNTRRHKRRKVAKVASARSCSRDEFHLSVTNSRTCLFVVFCVFRGQSLWATVVRSLARGGTRCLVHYGGACWTVEMARVMILIFQCRILTRILLCFLWPVSLRSGSEEAGVWRDSWPRPLLDLRYSGIVSSRTRSSKVSRRRMSLASPFSISTSAARSLLL